MEVRTLSQGDPADEALAAIASILDEGELRRGSDKAAARDKSAGGDNSTPARTTTEVEADGYSKIGPGPMDAIRFRWTVRHADGDDYYVDETIGENSVPIVNGPMSAEAAIRLVDEREAEAQQRFDRLRNEMASHTDTVELIQLGGG